MISGFSSDDGGELTGAPDIELPERVPKQFFYRRALRIEQGNTHRMGRNEIGADAFIIIDPIGAACR